MSRQTLVLMLSFSVALAACSDTPNGQNGSVGDGDAEDNRPHTGHDGDGDGHQDNPPPGLLLQSDVARDVNPHISSADRDRLAADNRDFAFDFFRVLREDDESANHFVSPFSISLAMGMTYGGARNDTKTQISEVLRFTLDDDVLHAGMNSVDLELASRDIEGDSDGADGDGYVGDGYAGDGEGSRGGELKLDIINQTWGQEGGGIEQDFLDHLSKNYGAGMRVVDFSRDSLDITEAVNDWVEARTNGLIKDFLAPLSPNTRLLLVNAIYFYGSWDSAFLERNTSTQPFASLAGSTTDVDLMAQRDRFGHFEGDNTVAASLPYLGDQLSLIAFMPADPDDDFLTWEENFTRQDFDEVVQHTRNRQELDLYFPRFEIDPEDSLSLNETLEEMGMPLPFDDCADFTGIASGSPVCSLEALRIRDVIHKAVIKIDEEGTEAAAATAVIIGGGDSDAGDDWIPQARFDRPFSFAIYDRGTDTILFMGRLVDP